MWKRKKISGSLFLVKSGSKSLDTSNYTEFKIFPLKSLEIFIAESLKIHVKYLIIIQNQKATSYYENVLLKIKKLDRLTFQLSIPPASQHNYVNELKIDIDLLSEDDDY